MISENLQGTSLGGAHAQKWHLSASENDIDVAAKEEDEKILEESSCVVSPDFPHEVIPQLPGIVLVHFALSPFFLL